MRIDNPGSRDRPCLQHCLECLVAFLEGGSGEVDADRTGCAAHAAPVVFEMAPLVKRCSHGERVCLRARHC
jgi:hypothetical protein